MWDWINCHLAGRHEFVVWANSNQVCLRCMRCGRRSNGWQVAGGDGHQHADKRHAGTRSGHGLVAGALALLGLLAQH
ncbi:MAG: hypothetical protein ACM3NQ_09155 [Bacteroidales bacterium]